MSRDFRLEASRAALEIPVPHADGSGRHIRVARSKLSAGFVADLFNAAGVKELDPDTYRYVNIYNPDAALRWDSSKLFHAPSRRALHPATGMSWQGASVAAALLDARLPSRTEWWVYARPAVALLRADPEAFCSLTNVAQVVGDTTPMATYPPIGGLLDPLGNACEWLADPHPDSWGSPTLRERYVAGASWSTPRVILQTSLMRSKWGRIGTRSIGARLVWDDLHA